MIKKTILIIEDNEVNMMLLRAVFLDNGYNVLESVDGMDIKSLMSEQLPDLIVMDYSLPVLSGAELTKKLKANEALKHIPVIACTAHATNNNISKNMLDAGCLDIIFKPYDIPMFLETVANHING